MATVFSTEALLKAHQRALKGKRLNFYATRFDCRLMSEINLLRDDLLSGKYFPRPYRRMTIQEPKERRIEAPAYRDRLVHHALHGAINPMYERRFIPDSFACRSGRGTHAGARRVQHLLRSAKAPLYVCQIDISKYYASINHRRLQELLGKVVDDADVMHVLRRIIESTDSGREHDALFPTNSYYHCKGRRGIPIGNLTSQLFANIYLHEADVYAKQQLKLRRYVRYMDDILFFHEDKAVLRQHRDDLVRFLYEDLYLTVNPRKSRIYLVSHGVDFVGYRIFPFRMRLRSSSVRRYRRRHKRKLRDVAAGRLDLDTFDIGFGAWKAHAAFAKAEGLIAFFEQQREDYLWLKDRSDHHDDQQRSIAAKQSYQLRLFDDV